LASWAADAGFAAIRTLSSRKRSASCFALDLVLSMQPVKMLLGLTEQRLCEHLREGRQLVM